MHFCYLQNPFKDAAELLTGEALPKSNAKKIVLPGKISRYMTKDKVTFIKLNECYVLPMGVSTLMRYKHNGWSVFNKQGLLLCSPNKINAFGPHWPQAPEEIYQNALDDLLDGAQAYQDVTRAELRGDGGEPYIILEINKGKDFYTVGGDNW